MAERSIEAKQSTDARGQTIYRVVVQGKVETVPIEWRYYLVSHPSGRRVAVAMGFEEGLAGRVGDADLRLVSGLDLKAAPAASVGRRPASGTPPR